MFMNKKKTLLVASIALMSSVGTVASAETVGETTSSVNIQGGDLTLEKWAQTLAFKTVTLNDLSQGPVIRTVTLPAGSFVVNNLTGADQTWSLAAGVTTFSDGTNQFDGSLALGDAQNKLVATPDLSGMKAITTQTTPTTPTGHVWQSKAMDAYLTVPATAGLGHYQATIRYQLQQGVGQGE